MIDRPIPCSTADPWAFITMSARPAAEPQTARLTHSSSKFGAIAGSTSASVQAPSNTWVERRSPNRWIRRPAIGIRLSEPTAGMNNAKPSRPALSDSRSEIAGIRAANVPCAMPWIAKITAMPQRCARYIHSPR